MRVLAQRVLGAKVTVGGKPVAKIESGLLLFAGFTHRDNESVVQELAQKVVNLRVFPDHNDRLQYSVVDEQKQLLVVPQFTLYGSASRGRRPDFTAAMNPEQASELFDKFIEKLSQLANASIQCGVFAAHMEVELVNDGPFTIMLERTAQGG